MLSDRSDSSLNSWTPIPGALRGGVRQLFSDESDSTLNSWTYNGAMKLGVGDAMPLFPGAPPAGKPLVLFFYPRDFTSG